MWEAIFLLSIGLIIYFLGYLAGSINTADKWSNLVDRLFAIIEKMKKQTGKDDADWWKEEG